MPDCVEANLWIDYDGEVEDNATELNMVKPWMKSKNEWKGYIRMRSVMDSGCGESVMPPGAVPSYAIQESPGSRRGQNYLAASKHTVPNLGQQIFNIETDEKKSGHLKYQVAQVSRPLNAVSEVCDAVEGNRVMMGKNGGVIFNIHDERQQTWFGRENGIYVFDYWIKPGPLTPKEESVSPSPSSDFRRPGDQS